MTLTIGTSFIVDAPVETPVQAIRRILDEVCANPSVGEFELDVESLKHNLEELRQGYQCELIEDLPGALGFFVEDHLRDGDIVPCACGDFLAVLDLQQRRELKRAA